MKTIAAAGKDDMDSGMSHSLPLLKDLREYFGACFDIITIETKKVLADEEYVFEAGCWKDQLKEHGFFNFHVSQSRKLALHSPIPVLSPQA